MKVCELIAYAREVRPESPSHAFSDDVLLIWINEIEGMVQTEILLTSPADIITYTADDLETELLVPAPHSKIYRAYLCSMIDFERGEYNTYSNSVELFREWWDEYAAWYALMCDPASGKGEIKGYYVSAYAIAVKHGYKGTEEEWLSELDLRVKDAEEHAADSAASAAAAMIAVTKYPMIGEDGYWYVWDTVLGEYAKTSVKGEGAPGDPGKSAYEYAKEAGYPDSEEQFAEDLANAGNGGGGIIDVPELPSENINSEVIYRLTTAEVMEGTEPPKVKCVCDAVAKLPETGKPFVDINTLTMQLYYCFYDKELYVYIDDTLSSTGLNKGWLYFEDVAGAAGLPGKFGGAIYSLEDALSDPNFDPNSVYVLLDVQLWHWNNERWERILTEDDLASLPGGGDVDLSDLSPVMNGTASPGTSEEVSRADHVHPTDISRMPSVSNITSYVMVPTTGGVIMYDGVTVFKVSWDTFLSHLKSKLNYASSADLTNHNTDTAAHNDIRLLIEGLTSRLNAIADSDDTTLDQLSELVAYIKANRGLIEGVTTSKVSVSDIVDNLATNAADQPLSAAQGVELKKLIDAITVPTKVSDLDNDKGYLTDFTETDPTVPSWAKASSKPSYTKSEVGLGNVDNVKQYSASNPPPYPVTSVNGKTGAVTVSVPTKVSAFSNDVGYVKRAELDVAKAEIVEDVLAEIASGGSKEITYTEQVGGYYNRKGVWTATSGLVSKYTNYIPVQSGDKFEYTGRAYWDIASILWFDVNQNLIAYEQYGNESTGAVATAIVTAPSNSAFVQFQSFNYETESITLSVTYIPEADESTKANTLYGKKIVYDGDSICIGTYGGGGYAKIIADRVGGAFVNEAVGGARLQTHEGSSSNFHSIVDNLTNLPTDGDLYCFEGGVNDVWSSVTLGAYSMSDYNGAVDKTTICGALETIFRYSLNNFVGKPICFVISHKVSNISFENYKSYHDAAVAICNKYSIPYYDAYNESGLNGWNTAQNNAFLTGNVNGTPDGCHPNEEGYKRYYVPQLISLFERIMPSDVIAPSEPVQPSYTNLLDEAGYEKGIYLTGQGATGADANAYTTGYMPITNPADIYLKNVIMPDESTHGNRISLYDSSKNFISGTLYNMTSDAGGTFDGNGNLIHFKANYTGQAYLRISAWGIDDTSIITVNEPIE